MSSGYSKYGKLKHSFIHNPFLFFLIILTILAFVFFLYGCRSKTEAIKDTYFPSAKSISAPQENKTEEEGEFYTFSDLPGILEGIGFIVGNKAPAEDIVTVSEIKAALFNKNIETGNAELADEVSNYKSRNYIVVGSPCDNPIAAELFKEKIRKKGNCNIFGEGVAYLKIFTTSPHNFVIYIGGGSSADTRKAGNILANYDEYVLEGRAIEITGPLSNPNLTMIIE